MIKPEVTHAMIHAELAAILQRSEEWDATLAQILGDLVVVKEVAEAKAATRTGGRFPISLGEVPVEMAGATYRPHAVAV